MSKAVEGKSNKVDTLVKKLTKGRNDDGAKKRAASKKGNRKKRNDFGEFIVALEFCSTKYRSKVVFAVHSEYSGTKYEDAALKAVLDWDKKYGAKGRADEAGIKTQWANARVDGGITIASLFDLAVERGYRKGMTRDDVEKAKDWQEDKTRKGELPPPFKYAKNGGITYPKTVQGVQVPTPLCSALNLIGESRTIKGLRHGLVLSISNERDGCRQITFEKEALYGEGERFMKPLVAAGLREIGSIGMLRQLFTDWTSKTCILTTDKVGWSEIEGQQVFVLPETVIGCPEGQIVRFTSDKVYKFAKKGSLADWQSQVATLAKGNRRLEFALSAAFAAPLLTPLGIEGGGFHFIGPSSTGKTTLLQVASSVYGSGSAHDGWISNLRTTDNGAEVVAYRHNDVLLCADEIGQANKFGEIAYMWANGQAKQRMKPNGEARERLAWRTLFVTTGEKTVEEIIEKDRVSATAGQSVRVLNIPALTAHGVFDDLKGFDGSGFANALKQATERDHGTAIEAFLAHVVENYNAIVARKPEIEALAASWTPPGADGQVQRAALRFAVVAFAGELAIEAGVLTWEEGSVNNATEKVFQDWLVARGGPQSYEALKGMQNVLRAIELHGASRFQTEDEDRATNVDDTFSSGFASVSVQAVRYPKVIHQRLGYRAIEEKDGRSYEVYYFFPDGFKKEVGNSDPRAVARLLEEKGLLQRGEGDNLARKCTPYSGAPRKRYYVIWTEVGDCDHLTPEQVAEQCEQVKENAEQARRDAEIVD